MRKVGLVFLMAIIVPSLVLAWLAVRSLRDQQLAMERQQFLVSQGVADELAQDIRDQLGTLHAAFAVHVEQILGDRTPREVARGFDATLRRHWPLAEVGFVVSLEGPLLSPAPTDSPAAQLFCAENRAFLSSSEVAEVYGTVAFNTATNPEQKSVFQTWNSGTLAPAQQQPASHPPPPEGSAQQIVNVGKIQNRKVKPVQQSVARQQAGLADNDHNYSRLVPAEAEFHQLIGDATDGMLARFVQNELKVMFWHRAQADPFLVFGAQLQRSELVDELRTLVRLDPLFRDELCVALLDDGARPVALSPAGFAADWNRPFVASELSEALPHWEVGVYLLHPERLAQAAHTARITLGLLIAVLTLAIALGGWLILADVHRQLRLTRQKTDFVSNVSHELKTPLTSIRMFSELLADGKVADHEKQRSYLQIIAAESARLTRLINNVLDFASLDRGEKQYQFKPFELVDWLTQTVETYKPHLESVGFTLDFQPPAWSATLRGDRDALSRVLMNLLSNAEKYSSSRKEICVRAEERPEPVRHMELHVLDRGPGVPPECANRIFEQFYRAHESLNSGVQGSGLGLTLARQIARAHGGDVTYRPREGGGSCFTLTLPLSPIAVTPHPGRSAPRSDPAWREA